MACRAGFLLLLSSLLAAAAGAEDLRVYPEPGGLHVVVADLVSTASYSVKVHDGGATQTLALAADGEAWAWTADPAPRLLTVTVLRGSERILATTAATGDPAALVDDAATSVALAAMSAQRTAVLARFNGQSRAAVESAFNDAKIDLLAVVRAVGRQKYILQIQRESSALATRTKALDNKLKTAETRR